MEQSRVGQSQSPHAGNAPVRGKTTAKSSGESAQEATAQGGFLALMAALEQAPEFGEALDLPQPAEDTDLAAIQVVDPLMLMNMQGLAVNGLSGGRTDLLQAEVGGAPWSVDLPNGGLVAQTTALDRLGDVKDGDQAASLMMQGRPASARATAAFAQRGEFLNVMTGRLSTNMVADGAGKTLRSAADDLSVAAPSLSVSSLRDIGVFPPAGAHVAGGSSASLGAIAVDDASVLTVQSLSAEPERGSDLPRLSDAGSPQGGTEGTWDGTAAEVQLPAEITTSSDVMGSFSMEEALSEQVTYWVNQKVQSAEMTVSKDGRPVEVSVTLSGNEAQVAFRSDQEQTRQMLDASIAQLSEMLREQGLVLSGASVGTSARDGRSSNGEQSQERGLRAGQTQVVAADGLVGRGTPPRVERSAIDVFV